MAVDGASGPKGYGGGIVFTTPEGFKIYHALVFNFKLTNNEAEYEALARGLRLAQALKISRVSIRSDSSLIVGQVTGNMEAREGRMTQYKDLVLALLKGFEEFKIAQIPRAENADADLLSKLTQCALEHVSKLARVEILDRASIEKLEVAAITAASQSDRSNLVGADDHLMYDLMEHLMDGSLPEQDDRARKVKLRAPRFQVLDGKLYKRAFGGPLLRCLTNREAEPVIAEVHEGVTRQGHDPPHKMTKQFEDEASHLGSVPPRSQDISASDAHASEESPSSSSSTGLSSPVSKTRSVPNPNIPEPRPVNQMPGQIFQERDAPVEDEPVPYDPENESYEEWVDRLEAGGYSPLPSSYPSDIYPRDSKIAQNKARRNLPEGYVLEYDPNWPNIIEPHRDDRVGFHIVSLESGTVFPLRPLLVELCHCFKILPGQITPNAHRFLNAFVNICIELKIDPSLRLFLYLFEVLPGKSGCDGYVYFKGRNGRQFISDLPQSNRQWKEKFVFIKFPTASPLVGIKWNDHILKSQYAEPASAPDLEESLEKLLQGDPFTGQMFHYGAWIWRIQLGGKGTPRAHEAAGHGVPSPGNTAEAGGPSHPVRKAPVNPSPNKGKGKKRVKHAATTHPSSKKRRVEHSPVRESMGELWVKMTLKLKEMGEVGPETLEDLAVDSSRSHQLEEKLKRVEAHNQELQDLIARQLEEVTNLSTIAEGAKAETLQLKEENLKLMEDLEQKEREFPSKARQWMEDNLVGAARVLTSSEERTMQGFKLLYREKQGKEMITQIGSYGFMSGQKRDREATHAVLAERDPDFSAESYGLAPIPDDEPAPPFPLN
ncbi:unnamed protein product [Cuscuta campestris]|uniref:RNase H type-1 domain-containing protein n=1 Tax=Cuscuta campestris TaxID=132261 RepID=A0A484KPB1_9ASTE|nr:unnamed protein product [Cuscuta campestris]